MKKQKLAIIKSTARTPKGIIKAIRSTGLSMFNDNTDLITTGIEGLKADPDEGDRSRDKVQVTYAKSRKYLRRFIRTFRNLNLDRVVCFTTHEPLSFGGYPKSEYNGAVFIVHKRAELAFTLLHNWVNRNRPATAIEFYGKTACTVHPTAVIGSSGMKYVKAPNGENVLMKHMGGVEIWHGVRIGPNTVVTRGTLGNTVIHRDVQIDGSCYIAHNVQIGQRTFVIAGANIGGSAKIGKDCWIGLGATIRNNITICDNVMIGMGAVVTKDIKHPGVYAGVPARYMREWDGTW